MTSLSDGIQDFLKNKLLIEGIDKDTALIDDGYIDSIQILELAMFIEETYELTMDANDMEVENFASINAIVNYVSQKRKLVT
jgi:acyl carrier protein